MKDILIPYYCFQTTAQYNSPANPKQIVNQNNQGAPISGFFESCGNNYKYKTQIIQNLMKLLVGCIGSDQALDYLIPFINEYHTNNNTWLNLKSMNRIDFEKLKKQVWEDLDMNWNDNNEYNDFLNNFTPVEAGVNYYINDKNQYILDHRCRTCSQNNRGFCKSDYNQQNYPYKLHQERHWDSNYSDEKNLYATFCDGIENHQKLQTELINAKISDFNQGGGKRRFNSKTRSHGKKRAKKNTRKRGGRVLMAERGFEQPTFNKFEPPHLVKSVAKSMKINKTGDSETFYHVNQDAERIYTKKDKDGKLIAGYGDWMGGFTPDLGLSLIFNSLLEKKILTPEQLDTLIKHRYVDYYVYLLQTDIHTQKLIEELGEKFQISPETIEKIRDVYKAGKAEDDKYKKKIVFKFKA